MQLLIKPTKEYFFIFLFFYLVFFFFGMGKGRGEGKVTSVLDVQSLFLIKENRICSMTRHHAKNILLARNFPFNSDVRQWSHSLMIPFHYLWAKSNNRTRVQFEYDVTFLLLLFFCLISFIHIHLAVAVP